ncbi:MAG TPA: hypothetical protein VFZ66_18940 [Herpetosiphonaceae bacterium]
MNKAAARRFGHLEGTVLVLSADSTDLTLMLIAIDVASKPCAPKLHMIGGRDLKAVCQGQEWPD